MIAFTNGIAQVVGTGVASTDWGNITAALKAVWSGLGRGLHLKGHFNLVQPVFSPVSPDGAGVPFRLTGESWWTIDYHGPDRTAALNLEGCKHFDIELGIKTNSPLHTGLRLYGSSRRDPSRPGSSSGGTIRGSVSGLPDSCAVQIGYTPGGVYVNDDINGIKFEDFQGQGWTLVSGMNTIGLVFLNSAIDKLWFDDAPKSLFPFLDFDHMLGGQGSTLIAHQSSFDQSVTFPGGLDYTWLGGRLERAGQIPEGTMPMGLVRKHGAAAIGKVKIDGVKIDGWPGTLADWVKDDQARSGLIWNGQPLALAINL